MILNTQSAGDGGWYWYATYFLAGKHIYSDLHLSFQPLFVLENAACLAILGKGWLASKIPAFIHAITYCTGLLLVLKHSKLSDRRKAVVFACVFFLTTMFEAYRFDDYHVVADCFEVYSLAALLALGYVQGAKQLSLVGCLGILSGLSLTTRLNDGAALFLAVAIAILCIARQNKLLLLGLFSFAGAITVVSVVASTGDTLQSYVTNSILKAAGSKGGAGSVLLAPLALPYDTYSFLRGLYNKEYLVYLLGGIAVWSVLILPVIRSRRTSDIWKVLVGITLLALPFRHFRTDLTAVHVVVILSGVAVWIAYGLGITVFIKWYRSLRGTAPYWDRRQIFLLIPLGQLASGSMSSAGKHIGLYGPLAVAILVLAVASPITLQRDWAKTYAVTVLLVVTICCASFKYRVPYLWHAYWSSRLFADRVLYHHPVYGTMIMEPKLYQFIEPICSTVHASGSKELLSLPFSYPNYFCAIEPWHGYVQTFFDTSTRETIERLMRELLTAPPDWIVYQRQPGNLEYHEATFNHGNPLPQRRLDTMIEQKISSGEWQSVYTSTYSSPDFKNDWVLIRTHP